MYEAALMVGAIVAGTSAWKALETFFALPTRRDSGGTDIAMAVGKEALVGFGDSVICLQALTRRACSSRPALSGSAMPKLGSDAGGAVPPAFLVCGRSEALFGGEDSIPSDVP
jgi:hypothetical protein